MMAPPTREWVITNMADSSQLGKEGEGQGEGGPVLSSGWSWAREQFGPKNSGWFCIM